MAFDLEEIRLTGIISGKETYADALPGVSALRFYSKLIRYEWHYTEAHECGDHVAHCDVGLVSC